MHVLFSLVDGLEQLVLLTHEYIIAIWLWRLLYLGLAWNATTSDESSLFIDIEEHFANFGRSSNSLSLRLYPLVSFPLHLCFIDWD